MINIKINLATRRYAGKGFGIIAPLVIILFSAALFLYLRGQARDYTVAAERLGKKVAELSARESLKPDISKETPEQTVDLAVVGDITGRRGFSWIEALDNLEKAIPSGISLSAIQPSFKEGGVKLSGYARDFAALSRFIDNLERLKVYKRVLLVNHSVKEMDNKKNAIIFNINIEGGK